MSLRDDPDDPFDLPHDCRYCPQDCGSCTGDNDCECYEHQPNDSEYTPWWERDD